MNLVQVVDSEKYIFHNEDVRTVFEISREIFQGNFKKIKKSYKERDIKAELAAVIGRITDSLELLGQTESKEAVNMCTSLEKLKEECGIKVLIETCHEFGKTYKETKEKVIEKFNLDEKKAQESMDNYWTEQTGKNL